MKIKAEQKFIRTSPRKIRLVAGSIKGLNPTEALEKLEFASQKAALCLSKVIKQALANATNNHNLSNDSLSIEHILVNEGPTYKRWQAVSRGRAHSILKRTSHVRIILDAQKPKQTPTNQTQQPQSVSKSASKPSTTTKKTKIK